ncbi:MAG: cytidylate kinase [Alteromonas naphthalenivorans]|jgi:cytidylate kinase
MIITIDGPAASGKSTISRMTAENLTFYYLNTGLLYRAVTYLLMHQYDYTKQTLTSVQNDDLVACTDATRFFYLYSSSNGPSIVYDNKDITDFLKDPVIDQYVSLISPQASVREALSNLQRAIAHTHDVVVEGRDVGSVVFPDADYKFYLTASLKVRAIRWQAYQEKKGNTYSLEQSMDRVEQRDLQDKNRAHSPLVVPDKAITIDNSNLTLKESVQAILKHIKN